MRVLILLALVAVACGAAGAQAHDAAGGSEGQELLEGLFSAGRKLADNVNGKCRLISSNYVWSTVGFITSKTIYTKYSASACCTECQRTRGCIYYNSCYDGRGASWCYMYR